jgi:hypothetical protein
LAKNIIKYFGLNFSFRKARNSVRASKVLASLSGGEKNHPAIADTHDENCRRHIRNVREVRKSRACFALQKAAVATYS